MSTLAGDLDHATDQDVPARQLAQPLLAQAASGPDRALDLEYPADVIPCPLLTRG
ncbi:MAG TPA: hypothetical protein VNF47_18605 [Streptosporangiaceae bacterium]|nr:hypothetical protein [Streptosporangiaceae bacterium]